MEFNLKDYLKKFEAFLPFESRVKNAVVQSVREIVGVELDRKSIRVQGTQVFIAGSAALKSEIAMKQAKILARVKELQPEIGVKRIQ